MVVHGRVELLAHPLSQKYLQMKWHSYGKYFHLTNLLLYSIFLLFVTGFSTELMQLMHEHDRRQANLTQGEDGQGRARGESPRPAPPRISTILPRGP